MNPNAAKATKAVGIYGMPITLKAESNQFDEGKEKELVKKKEEGKNKNRRNQGNGEIFIETVVGIKPK